MTSEAGPDGPAAGTSQDDPTAGTVPDDASISRGADVDAATETFGLLSDETRVRILLALEEGPAEGLTFSDLQARVGVRDGGRFNYHLEKLRGRLVTKSEETYVLTPAGAHVTDVV